MKVKLSESAKQRLLGQMQRSLEKGGEHYTKQMDRFNRGEIVSQVIAGRARWILKHTDVKWMKPYEGSYYLGYEYMHYGKPDAEEYSYQTIMGVVKMENNEMYFDTGSLEIGGTEKMMMGDTVELKELDLNEDSIDIILGPAIMI